MGKTRLDESAKIRKGSVSVTIKAEALEIETDPAELGKLPARAIARDIAEGIRNVTELAAPRTLRRRIQHGVTRSAKWNATGKLADTIEAERDGKGYTISTADDRLQRDELHRMLVEDVPAVDDPLTPGLDAAINATLDALLTKQR